MATGVSRLSPKHEFILEWLLVNPDGSLADCARALGMDKRWVAQVIASDSFQASYAKRCEQRGLEGMFLGRQRVQALQSLAVERGIELLETGAASERFVSDLVKASLPQAPVNGGSGGRAGTHLHLHVSAGDILEARALEQQAHLGSTVPRKLIEVSPIPEVSSDASPDTG